MLRKEVERQVFGTHRDDVRVGEGQGNVLSKRYSGKSSQHLGRVDVVTLVRRRENQMLKVVIVAWFYTVGKQKHCY